MIAKADKQGLVSCRRGSAFSAENEFTYPLDTIVKRREYRAPLVAEVDCGLDRSAQPRFRWLDLLHGVYAN